MLEIETSEMQMASQKQETMLELLTEILAELQPNIVTKAG
jgi:hypothetical protein